MTIWLRHHSSSEVLGAIADNKLSTQWAWIWPWKVISPVRFQAIQWANLSVAWQELAIARILGQPAPATGLVSLHLLHSYGTWLQETQVSESKHTVTHFILSMPGRTGLYSHVWCFKMCCPHLHFRKILCWQSFAPPETDFKRKIVYRGKTPFSKSFFCTLIGSSKPFFWS